MKKFRYGLFALIFVLFAGCYEINEEIVVNENGSGTYVTKMDMSALIEMMKTMAGEEELTKGGMDRVIDTIIPLKDIIDSVKDMNAEEKELYSAATMDLKMNIKENIFKADMHFSFKNFAQLQQLMSGAGSGGITEVFKKLYGAGDNAAAPSDQGLDQLNSIFDVTVTNGQIVKKINEEKYKALMEKPEIAQIKTMSGAGMEILYTTVINLPRPVKESDNPMIKLSADKKTVTIKYNLLTIFDAPESFSYSIVY